jgi:hypothetical protein
MAIKHITVNDKDLTTFEKYDGTKQRADARRLLAYEDDIKSATAGAGHAITAWFRGVQALNWTAPDGYEIAEVSVFCGEDQRTPSVSVSLDRTEGDA